MPKTKLSIQNQSIQPKPLSIIDIPGQPATMTIDEACVKFNLSRQMVEDIIISRKVFTFTTGMSDKGKRKISTYDLIEKANLFPKEALMEILKMEHERQRAEQQKKAS